MNNVDQGTVKEKIRETEEALEKTVQNPWTKRLARFGFVAKGIIFIVIGALAILVAVGDRSGELTGAQGALSATAQAPFGSFLFLTLTVGSIIFGSWHILRGAADIDDDGVGTLGIAKRIFAAGLGIFYIFVGLSALYIFWVSRRMSDSGEDEVPKTITYILLSLPLGQILVALVGLGFLIAAGVQVYQAFSFGFLDRFKSHIREEFYKAIITTGVFSHLARAILSFLIGYFFMTAAIYYDSREAVGLDGAMTALAGHGFGKTILFFTAFGLICHGLLSILEAKFRRLD